jgi:hypothetical protein
MARLVEKLFEAVVENLISCGDVDICHEYGEPGYHLEEGKEAILFSNWNPYDKYPNFMELLEATYDLEWSDEWIISYEHGKAYRTSPDSYSWQKSFMFTESGEILTPDDDVEYWIEECKLDYIPKFTNPRALPSFIEGEQIEAEGFELINDDLQSGWYDRVDDPRQILEECLKEYGGEYDEIVFSLNGVGQFAVDFSAYGRKL